SARSRCVDPHDHLAVLDARVVHRHRPRRGERLRLAGDERERAAVLPALDLAVLTENLALGRRDVGVRATVTDGVYVVVTPHDGDAMTVDVHSPRGARRQLVERARHDLDLTHGCT